MTTYSNENIKLTNPTVDVVIPCEIEGEMQLCQVKYYRPNWLNKRYPRANGVLGDFYWNDEDDGHYIVVGMETIGSVRNGEGLVKNKVKAYLMCVATSCVVFRTIETKADFFKRTKVRITGDELLAVRDRIFKEKIGNGK